MGEKLEKAYALGFAASAEGYNAEYPFEMQGADFRDIPDWIARRDTALAGLTSPSDELARLRAENARLRKALHPLSDMADLMDASPFSSEREDEFWLGFKHEKNAQTWWSKLTSVSAFYEARAALTDTEKE